MNGETGLSESSIVDITYINTEKLQSMDDIEGYCLSVLKMLDVTNGQLSIIICDDQEIRRLNNMYRSKDTPTDVLAFGQLYDGDPVPGEEANDKSGKCLGDIVISAETCLRNARRFHVPFQEEMERLLVHGILHLLGMDHDERDSSMIRKQEQLLRDIKQKKN